MVVYSAAGLNTACRRSSEGGVVSNLREKLAPQLAARTSLLPHLCHASWYPAAASVHFLYSPVCAVRLLLPLVAVVVAAAAPSRSALVFLPEPAARLRPVLAGHVMLAIYRNGGVAVEGFRARAWPPSRLQAQVCKR